MQWIASERFTGSYMRQLSLGEGVDAQGVSASYANGVLTVTIPLAAQAKPRRIQVESASDKTVIQGIGRVPQADSAPTAAAPT